MDAGHVKLFKVSVAAEEFLMIRDSVVLNPDIRVVQTIWMSADVRFPVVDEKVEIVRAIAKGRSALG
jgi:hypothetical protein